ncbi:MAG: hypothetical protein P8X57_07910 [Cyclobacteriaceae bacterium]
MKTVTDINLLSDIANGLKRSAAIYNKAAQSVNEGVVTAELEQISARREKFADQVIDEINKHMKGEFQSEGTIDLQRNVELVLGDLLVRQNVPPILKACADSDSKLIELYSDHLEHNEMRDEIRILLNKQYNSILELHKSLEERINKYPWFTG